MIQYMKLYYLFLGVLLLIMIHFVCYIFNIDAFELFEKKAHTSQDNSFIQENIHSLNESLEQLKEITNNSI